MTTCLSDQSLKAVIRALVVENWIEEDCLYYRSSLGTPSSPFSALKIRAMLNYALSAQRNHLQTSCLVSLSLCIISKWIHTHALPHPSQLSPSVCPSCSDSLRIFQKIF
jgi:hypothetical protein